MVLIVDVFNHCNTQVVALLFISIAELSSKRVDFKSNMQAINLMVIGEEVEQDEKSPKDLSGAH